MHDSASNQKDKKIPDSVAFNMITDMLINHNKAKKVNVILLEPERKLLNTLVQEYDAGCMFFNKHTKSWCIIARNNNNIIASFLQHIFTLSIDFLYYIDDILELQSDIKEI